MFLTQTLEFVERYAHLPEDLKEQRRPDFAASVDRNRHGAPVWVIPSFVASRLSRLKEAQSLGHSLKLSSGRARHAVFR